jgi:multimeric flavodoxin WrbA
MKITLINGSMRHGSTWHCADAVLQELRKTGDTQVTEFFLPRDMPHFCNGCFSCIYHGEDTCPHASSIQPLVEAMTQADLIVLTSPVYAMDVSGGMKALLDHLCFMWMSHRPNAAMFGKVGLTVVTAAGSGLSHTAKTLKNSLRFWGVKKVYGFSSRVAAMKWSDVSEKTQAKIRRNAEKLAVRIVKSVSARTQRPLFRSFFFRLMAGMQKKNDWNPTDRNHWLAQGWLEGKRPF